MGTEQLVHTLKRCRKNDRNAQRELYEGFYRYGLSVCMRYVADLEVARELLNDGFMKVFLNFNQYKDDLPFVNWFKRILVNTCINHLRKAHQNVPTTDLQEAHHVEMDLDFFGQFSVEEIAKLIQQLSPAYRTVFNLYVIEGYEHKEIAEMLGISVGTSLSNLAKARKKLQELIEDKDTYERARL
ncbi:RNA polymerase sigma-70 factor, ECF subfamily [Pseudarcicella hirudinis]|uniref:RNA polymerase sigma-70 factor, ECF subfamily n=1 Tax=Pseudarcicella hirudinis TaxID=1079859 RepID=A0A1I5TNM0_9BACT|nr:RNA polymerase sigma factor [Pseudarcicella hirudinis]SFP84635.1 RNA polymerase sigma-70 factor, ECF subfamily [Pseudarcicella hirudinis]